MAAPTAAAGPPAPQLILRTLGKRVQLDHFWAGDECCASCCAQGRSEKRLGIHVCRCSCSALLGRAACADLLCALPRARTAGEAIEAGIARLGAGEARAAVDLFQAALELPGNGAFRMSGTVREYRRAARLSKGWIA